LGLRAAMRALDVYLKKEPVPLRADLGSIPTRLGEWQKIGDDIVMDAAMVESLGTDRYLSLSSALGGDPARGVISLHLAYYTCMIDTVPHIPERCWGAGGLIQAGDPERLDLAIPSLGDVPADAPENRATGQRYPMVRLADPVTRIEERVALPIGALAMTLTTFQDPKAARIKQLGGYMFVANGRCTPSTIGVRELAFDLTDRYAYYCKVQLSARYPDGEPPPKERFRRDAEDLLAHLFPHLMRRLPDWPTVERTETDKG
ncbi:MAG: hypothetical protein ACKORL_05625, partial [Phycisphaerales bacterium]